MKPHGQVERISKGSAGLPIEKVNYYRSQFEIMGFELPELDMEAVTSSCELKAKKKNNTVSVSGKLKTILETEMNQTISCGSCLEFLQSLNKSHTFNHDKIVQQLLQRVPIPDWWNKKYNKQERKDRISQLIEPVIPKQSIATVLAAVVKNKVESVKDSDWAVVVTTAPRQESTLLSCLLSLKENGWEPTIFAEPESSKPKAVKFNFIDNPVRLGAWHNWLQSVKWALANTTASHILSVQDDSRFHPESRSVAEQLMYPTDKVGFISLYTASHYSADRSGNKKPVGINRIITSSFWGACAMVFPREALQQIVNHPIVAGWTGVSPSKLSDKDKRKLLERKKLEPHLIQNVDTAIGKIVNSLHLEMYTIDPSPVRHIAKYSTIGHGSDTGKRNCGRCADHKQPLIDQVFPNA